MAAIFQYSLLLESISRVVMKFGSLKTANGKEEVEFTMGKQDLASPTARRIYLTPARRAPSRSNVKVSS